MTAVVIYCSIDFDFLKVSIGFFFLLQQCFTTQVSVGHVVPGGAADADGHLCPGDEITYINGLCVIGASHRKVVQLMTDAAHTGRVTMRVRRKAGPAHGLNFSQFLSLFSYCLLADS